MNPPTYIKGSVFDPNTELLSVNEDYVYCVIQPLLSPWNAAPKELTKDPDLPDWCLNAGVEIISTQYKYLKKYIEMSAKEEKKIGLKIGVFRRIIEIACQDLRNNETAETIQLEKKLTFKERFELSLKYQQIRDYTNKLRKIIGEFYHDFCTLSLHEQIPIEEDIFRVLNSKPDIRQKDHTPTYYIAHYLIMNWRTVESFSNITELFDWCKEQLMLSGPEKHDSEFRRFQDFCRKIELKLGPRGAPQKG